MGLRDEKSSGRSKQLPYGVLKKNKKEQDQN